MPKRTGICRVCGATYESCNSVRTGSSVFNWREVACSPECGATYLNQVRISRGQVKVEEPEQSVEVVEVEEQDLDEVELTESDEELYDEDESEEEMTEE